MGALDMAVVINFDPFGRLRQIESISQTFKQFVLRRRLRHLSSQTFSGVSQGAFDKVRLFPALRDLQIDSAASFLSQSVGHQLLIVQSMRQQHHPRRLSGGVELSDKRFHYFHRIFVTTDPRVKVVIAPVLVGADEKDLDASLPAVDMQRKDIRLRHTLRVDPL